MDGKKIIVRFDAYEERLGNIISVNGREVQVELDDRCEQNNWERRSVTFNLDETKVFIALPAGLDSWVEGEEL